MSMDISTKIGANMVVCAPQLRFFLQLLAAAGCYLNFIYGGIFGLLLCLYLLQTSFWYLTPLYIVWIYLDRTTCETGGRPIKWVRNWAWWYYVTQYYQSQLTCDPNFTLDLKKNYFFCCFPHGIVPTGTVTAFLRGDSNFSRLLPNFVVKVATLHFNFYLPFVRELYLSMGCVSCSVRSIDWVLSRPQGGQVVLLWPGGAEEALESKPGRYKLVVMKRKGFVKIAMKNGSPLVPVITFGETDLFEQIDIMCLRKIQDFIKTWTGIALVLTRGFIPRRKRLVTWENQSILKKLNNQRKNKLISYMDVS
ncbi:2-acylglycerol O-acyltransferase 1-like isoform X2 [Tribolium madens]|uniref:2-acylglycerol O-acyltransferase 1-like isoform X2 n=1 Tax=Tribolium madens TaxID=41895 RepID=UPI001CF73AAB|nr:2-acylglycerol O-acyltransferase 1-like isoform X2 [Tribolium madens]